MTTVQVPAHFADDVLTLLVRFGAAHQPTGNREGEMSLSHLVACLRNGDGIPRRWRVTDSGWNANIRALLTSAGFTVREHRAGRAVRNYVSL